MSRIKELFVSKIDAVKQKQHKENFARKINPCYSCGQIITRNVHLEEKNASIAVKKVINICITESQKIKRDQK